MADDRIDWCDVAAVGVTTEAALAVSGYEYTDGLTPVEEVVESLGVDDRTDAFVRCVAAARALGWEL